MDYNASSVRDNFYAYDVLSKMWSVIPAKDYYQKDGTPHAAAFAFDGDGDEGKGVGWLYDGGLPDFQTYPRRLWRIPAAGANQTTPGNCFKRPNPAVAGAPDPQYVPCLQETETARHAMERPHGHESLDIVFLYPDIEQKDKEILILLGQFYEFDPTLVCNRN